MTRRRPFAGVPRERPPWYQIGPVLALAPAPAPVEGAPVEAPPVAGKTADVYLFDVIGGWFGMTADDFVRDVASLDVDQIVLHLNTPGGDASEGVAIANVLRAHRARIVVRVDGMAASAGSVIAMAGDEIVMGIGSQIMIHDAWGYAQGNAGEMAAAQRMLDSTSDALASTYAAKAGGTTAQWRAVMQAEAWYTPEEAVAAGLADRVAAADEVGTAEGEQITPGAGGFGDFWGMWDSLADPQRFDLSAYVYAGREHAPAPPIPNRSTPAASADGPTEEEGEAVAFSDDELSTIRQKLGVAEDADGAAVIEALDEALDERADPAGSELPEGVSTIDTAQLEELRAAASLGQAAHARQQLEDRQALVAAAVADGRIAPARRDAWLANLAADAGAAETLASLQKGLVPVGAPIGHSGEGDSVADALYDSVFGKGN